MSSFRIIGLNYRQYMPRYFFPGKNCLITDFLIEFIFKTSNKYPLFQTVFLLQERKPLFGQWKFQMSQHKFSEKIRSWRDTSSILFIRF